mmetsp:Transcript_27516/g.64135  ORF Transcript_27516/g.64135 Transcript_27516/m.64135 type:complete len:366 (+) Transcript_27516:34-1131(+)
MPANRSSGSWQTGLVCTAAILVVIGLYCSQQAFQITAHAGRRHTGDAQTPVAITPSTSPQTAKNNAQGQEASIATTSTSPPPNPVQVLRDHAGLYRDKTAHIEFKEVVLLTAANFAYLDFLANWECYAERLGLDWVAIALDPQAYAKLDPTRTLQASGETSAVSMEFRSKTFNIMALNSLTSVLNVMKLGFDVVFSDTDNVFLSDPFRAGISLGDLIREQKYDYIYQLNWPGPRPYTRGQEIDEGNTGFYYASLRRKPKSMNRLWEATLQEALRHQHLDGQTNFWKAVLPCFRICQQDRNCSLQEDSTLDYCEMDPFLHRTGWGKRDDVGPVSYHANFKVGRESKISAMINMGVWTQGQASCKPA